MATVWETIDLEESFQNVHTCLIGPLCALWEHECKIQNFIDDPITQYYGVADEFLERGDITCEGCTQLQANGGSCGHGSCEALLHEMMHCSACLDQMYESMYSGY